MASTASRSPRLKKKESEAITRPCTPNSLARAKGPAEFPIRAGLKDMKLETQNTCGGLQISGLDLGEIWTGGIDEGSNHFGGR
jgi:hypothetical protein